MGWLLALLSAVIAAIAGCLMAFYLGERCITWYRVSSFEGGSAYFVISMALAGLVGGFFIGLFAAKTWGTGFFHGAGLALGAVAGVMGVVYVLARMGGDVPPEIDGDTLQLMVELRMPPEWKPSNLALAGENACTLTSLGGGVRRRPKYGEIEINWAAKQDGPWVVPCEVALHSDRERRLLGIRLGKKTDIEFVLPLPPRPTPANEQWSAWTSTGFAQPVGQPPVAGYAYRVRVKRTSIAYQERAAADTAAFERRKREFERLNSSSPLKDWLPLAMDDRNDQFSGEAQSHMAARLAEAGTLLRDDDPAIVFQTLDLLQRQTEIPAALHADAIAAGRKILPLIARARLAADPDDPDLRAEKLAKNLGFVWKMVAEKTGEPLEPVKAEILAAASYAKSGEIYELTYLMR